jgi:hypothetical protein
MLALLLAMMLGPANSTTLVRGTVRASDDGTPLGAALVEVVDGASRVRTDSAGVYALQLAGAGTFHLRVSRLGYVPRTLDVVVGAAPLSVDVVLTPQPYPLSELTVRSTAKWPATGSDRDPIWAEPGLRAISGSDLHANPALASADVLQSLAAIGTVGAVPELMSTLHVRGGSSDQNLVMVDGIPVYNLYHGGGMLTAINPDAVSSATLHGAVPAPQFGGALSSVVEMRTDDSRPSRLTASGAMDQSGIRQTVAAPLPWSDGSLLLSARRSLSELYPVGDGQPRSTAYADALGKATVRLGRGHLELLALGSSDQLAFESLVVHQSSTAIDNQWPAPPSAQNKFQWSTGTQGVVWNVDDSTQRWQLRAWHSSFAGTSTWARTSNPIRLTNDWSSVGVGGLTSWTWSGTDFMAGADAERIHDGYRVAADPLTPLDTSRTVFAMSTQVPLVSVFVQARREFARRWTLVAGARQPVGGSSWRLAEPRVAMQFRASPRVVLSAGFARMHQQSQSLRNEESLLDGIVGVALPVTASKGGAPVGRSDQLALSADARFGGVNLQLEGYVRKLDGLLLVAPATAQPFGVGAYEIGSGLARGVGISASHHGERLVWSVGYSMENTTRRSGPTSYDPMFGISRTVSASAGFRVDPQTTFRIAGWGASGRPSSVSLGAFDWTPSPMLHGAGNLAGSPQQLAGALGGARLPAYWRVDVGVRHEWRPTLLAPDGMVAASLGVINVFNRTNTAALVQATAGASRQAIGLAPRSLVLGLEWRY